MSGNKNKKIRHICTEVKRESMNTKEIKVVILDFDDTIYRGDVWAGWGEYVEGFLTKEFKTQEVAQDFMARYQIDDHTNGHNIAKAMIKEKGSAKTFVRFMEKNFYQLPLKNLSHLDEELLKRVAKKFSLYIVSNSTKRYVKFHLKKFGINKNMFKKIYQNNFYAHNTTKTPYYAKILAREKVAPHEAVMIGDSYENDIVPAINMGINGVHIKSLAETTTVLKNLCEGV